jgi:hypothetical protein
LTVCGGTSQGSVASPLPGEIASSAWAISV